MRLARCAIPYAAGVNCGKYHGSAWPSIFHEISERELVLLSSFSNCASKRRAVRSGIPQDSMASGRESFPKIKALYKACVALFLSGPSPVIRPSLRAYT